MVYRSQFTTAAPDLRLQAAEQFSAWIASKGVTAKATSLLSGHTAEVLSPDGTRRVVRSTAGTYTDPSTGRHLLAAAFHLDEHQDGGTSWTTSLRLAEPNPADAGTGRQLEEWPEAPWIWLDLEHHRGDTGTIVRPGSPRLIRDLLAAVEGTDGSLPLTSDLLDITAGHVDELCGWMFDERRRVPVIVFAPDPQSADDQLRFATRLARDVAGVAVVVRLPDAAAAAALSRNVGPHLQVYGGAMRTYLPGLTPQEQFPRRHRVLSATTMRALRFRSANAVRDQVLGLSTRRTPPSSYPLVRRVLARGSAGLGVRRQPAPTAADIAERAESAEANRTLRSTLTLAGIDPAAVPLSGATNEHLATERQSLQALLIRSLQTEPVTGDATAELDLVYAELGDLTRQLDYLGTERDVVTIDLNDAERANEHLRARVRWLESELTHHQVHLAGVAPPDEFALSEVPSSVVEVLDLAGGRLQYLEIGATADAAAGLDVHPRAEHWALKIWQALDALNSYAEARRSGQWSNSFLAWCLEPPPGRKAVPATWTALSESETTNTKPRLREARTFAVPEAVTAGRRLYMPAHIKIAQGGSPCPRIHFYDDSGGATGRIYVGYVGDHLPTANFR